MAILLVVIGIPAWSWKSKLLLYAKKNPNLVKVKTKGICHECSRHLELLEYFDENRDTFSQSEYFRYQRKNNKNKKTIMRKIANFRKLYEKVKRGDNVGYPVITDDGCRLDGSHRCAIAVHRLEPTISVNMVSYESKFSSKQSQEIRDQVQKYRKQVYQL